MSAKKITFFILLLLFFKNNSISFVMQDIETFDAFEETITTKDGDSEINIKEDLDANCNIGCLEKEKMKIEGNNHCLKGNSNEGIIVEKNKNLEIKNLKIENFSAKDGGAITVDSNSNLRVEDVDFSENSAQENGGAIYNNSNIEFIKGGFKSNFADSQGGAVYNNGNIDTIIGNFSENSATVNGGAIYNQTQGRINTIIGNFQNNSAINGYAGAVYNFGEIGKIIGNFENNTSNEFGGAIVNLGDIDSLNGNFDSNKTLLMGGAIYNTGNIGKINGIFQNNESTSDMFGGGAIGNFGTIEELRGNFLSNRSNGRGGAIYNSYFGKLNILSDMKDIIFSNNTDSTGNNAIYNESGEINFNLGDYNIIFDDKIDGAGSSTSTINIDSIENKNPKESGSIVFNNEVKNNTVNMKNGTIEFGSIQDGENQSFGNFDKSVNFNVYGGSVNLKNNNIQNTNLGNLTLYNNMDITLDADLKSEKMDTISVESFQGNNHGINIKSIEILSPTTKKTLPLDIISSEVNEDIFNSLKDSIRYTGEKTIESPIYKYNVYYDNNEGKMIFTVPNNNFERFNPSILKSPIAAQIGGYLTLLNTYNEAFKNMDMYMLSSEEERLGNLDDIYVSDNSIEPIKGEIRGYYQKKYFYIRPYNFLENVPLKAQGGNKLKVDNVAYGSLFGMEKHFKIKKKYNFVFSPYLSYNGSNQHYNGNSIYQNGGLGGFLGMFYHDNFYAGFTMPIGANACSGKGKIEDDNFAMFLLGAAFKSGYNKTFKNGKYIIQPSFLIAYSFIDTFDYKNSRSVEISSKPLNVLTLSPEIKLIGNFENNFQPYLMVNMVWNLTDKTDFSANDTALPYLSVKPFVRYGIGIRKIINDRLDGFIQATVMNGGINGISFYAGLRMELDNLK